MTTIVSTDGMNAGNERQFLTQPQMLQFQPQQQQNLCPPDSTIWMGDLNTDWDANYIREAFGPYSKDITNVKLVTSDHGTKKATYCFVEFRDEDSARRAILDVNGKKFHNDSSGRARFNLAFANTPNHTSIEYNLFVNNLAPGVDDVALFRIFGEKYRSCRGAKVYRHEDGSSKEQGFVRFTSETDQQRALLEMNKKMFFGREIYLKLARPKTRTTGRFARGNFHHSGGRGGGHMMMGSSGYHQSATGFIVGQMPNAVPTIIATGVPYGVAGVMPGAPITLTQYGSQLAPNHGIAGFNAVQNAPQQLTGQPIIAYQQNPYVQPQYQQAQVGIMHPGSSIPPIIAQYPNQIAIPTSHFNPKPAQPEMPLQPFYEDVEPLSAQEHNALMINSSAELHTALEASRWGPVSFTPDTRKKELFNLLHSVQ